MSSCIRGDQDRYSCGIRNDLRRTCGLRAEIANEDRRRRECRRKSEESRSRGHLRRRQDNGRGTDQSDGERRLPLHDQTVGTQKVICESHSDPTIGRARSDGARRYPVPVPGPGEMLIEMAYSGLNFTDIYRRSGVYANSPSYRTPLPYGLGIEARVPWLSWARG